MKLGIEESKKEIEDLVSNNELDTATKKLKDFVEKFSQDKEKRTEAIDIQAKYVDIQSEKRQHGSNIEVDKKFSQLRNQIIGLLYEIEELYIEVSKKNQKKLPSAPFIKRELKNNNSLFSILYKVLIFILILLVGFLLLFFFFKEDKEQIPNITTDSNIKKIKLLEQKQLTQTLNQKNNEPFEEVMQQRTIKEASIDQFMISLNSFHFNDTYKIMRDAFLIRNIKEDAYLKYWTGKKVNFILVDIDISKNFFKMIIDFDKEKEVEHDLLYQCKFNINQNRLSIFEYNSTKLKNFDSWKDRKSMQLNFVPLSKITKIKGKLFKNKPFFSSSHIRKVIDGKAYVDTKDGRFYVSKYSLNNLAEDKIANWVRLEYIGSDNITYIPIFNKNGVQLKSSNRILYLGKDCDSLSSKENKGNWYQLNDSFIVNLENEKIIFNKQRIEDKSLNCEQ